MRRFRTSHDTTEMALANFALTFAKALLVFCVVLFLLINPQGKDGFKPKAEFLVTVDWSAAGRYDVDTWMRIPDGNRINFRSRESGVAFLERDDLGDDCNLITHGGATINACEEITVLRGVVPGQYVVALHLYSANTETISGPVSPVTVTVKIEKLNPTVQVVWQTVTTLDKIRQEKDLVGFVITSDGNITDFETDDLPAVVYSQ